MIKQRPKEHDYASYVAYGRALEDYCNALEGQLKEQKPVAWMHTQLASAITHRPADLDRHPDRWTPLYTSPPQREWAGLTCVDYAEICRAADDKASALIMAEDLLREQNT
jgi:hypothetical protein